MKPTANERSPRTSRRRIQWRRGQVIAIVAVLFVAVIVGGLVVRWIDSEPRWSGKPVRYWVRMRTLPGPSAIAARQASIQARADSVPALVKALNANDTTLSQFYRRVWTNTPALVQRHLPLPIEARRVRRAAANILAEMGTNAAVAVPALKLALKDPDDGVQSSASFALRMIIPAPTNATSATQLSLDGPGGQTRDDSNDFGVRLVRRGSSSWKTVQFVRFGTNSFRTNSLARP